MRTIQDMIDRSGLLNRKPRRIESAVAMDIRVAVYPNGEKRIQGNYQWSEGDKTGWKWKDLPMVYVDTTGQERKRG